MNNKKRNEILLETFDKVYYKYPDAREFFKTSMPVICRE